MKNIKVLVKLSAVPDGGKIIKKTGSTVYLVTDAIVLYSANKSGRPVRVLRAADSNRILVKDGGLNFSEYPASTQVLWVVDPYRLSEWLDRQIQGHANDNH